MARTHVHSPATFPQADLARSNVNSGIHKYGSSSSHVSPLISSFLGPLNSSSMLKKSSRDSRGLPDISQLLMSILLPLTISKYTPAGSRPNWNRMTTPSKIRLISSGGLAKAFSVFMSPGVMESRADLASSRAGPAAARSFSASAFPAATTAASLANTSFTAVTSAFFFSAFAVDSVISTNRMSVSFCAATNLTSFCARSTFISRTSSPACCSFNRPPLILSART
mmetsp:Transcript_20779/g.35686  ORF Transcript_20779/g.35686 Transcript_20779/m.35686 type:complete len:225 (-) Transcript_20779:9280-9954(-)